MKFTQHITPNLWFDSEAEDAARFYASIFPDSKIGTINRYGKEGFEIHGQPEGKVLTVSYEICGVNFINLNGGPIFKVTPAISFIVICVSKAEADQYWNKLIDGGSALMEIGSYPFSERYGWLKDKYGVTWQILYLKEVKMVQKIVPSLMFTGVNAGKAREAMNLYTSVFPNSKIGDVIPYEKDEEPDKPGTIKYANFILNGMEFSSMDSAQKHDFNFNEGVSLMVTCKDQKEYDRYWDTLKEGGDPKAQVCGWLKDKYGVSWQITSKFLEDVMRGNDQQRIDKVMKSMLQMGKLDIAELERAYNS